MSDLDKDSLIAAFLKAEGRAKRALFQQLKTHPLIARDLEVIAVALRDPSPKLSARIVSLLAKSKRRDLLEANLDGLKPGKVDLLRRHYLRIAGRD